MIADVVMYFMMPAVLEKMCATADWTFHWLNKAKILRIDSAQSVLELVVERAQ